MKRVRVVARLRILDAVGRGQDHDPARREHARELGDHPRLVFALEMLDRLERDDRVQACVGKRKRRRGPFDEPQVRDIRVDRSRMVDRRAVDIDADDLARDSGKERAAVAFAAGDVRSAPPRDVPAREGVSMPVLERDLAFDARHEALTGEFEMIGHGKPRSRLVGTAGEPSNSSGSLARSACSVVSSEGDRSSVPKGRPGTDACLGQRAASADRRHPSDAEDGRTPARATRR